MNQHEHLTSSQELEFPEYEGVTVAQEDVCDVLNTTLTEDEVSNALDTSSCSRHGLDTSSCNRQYSRAVSQYSTAATPRKSSVSGLSHDQIRANVIKEIITTERDFVKHLRDVVEVSLATLS